MVFLYFLGFQEENGKIKMLIQRLTLIKLIDNELR